MELQELDQHTTYAQQLRHDGGPIVLINQINVAPEHAERFIQVWAEDAGYMRQQPGCISTQLHRGTAGSSTFINIAVWETAQALGAAANGFYQRGTEYPDSAIVTPHIFEKIAVPGICVA